MFLLISTIVLEVDGLNPSKPPIVFPNVQFKVNLNAFLRGGGGRQNI
jgi:hypothetical protein